MSDAPERIWADAPGIFDGTDLWHTSRETAEETATEYVRADIFAAKDAEIARLRGLLMEAGELTDAAIDPRYGSKDDWDWRDDVLSRIGDELRAAKEEEAGNE